MLGQNSSQRFGIKQPLFVADHYKHTQNGLLTHMHTLLFLLQLLRILSLSRRSQKSQPLHQESALVQGD